MDSTIESIKVLYNKASKSATELVNKAKMTEHLFMIILAIFIGLLAGFGALGIRVLIHTIADYSYSGDGNYLENVIAAPWYIKVLIPALGGLIVGPIIYFFAPEAKGHGVPEVMQSVIKKGGIIRPRVAFVKAFASAVTIGTGGSVGREGPIIQIGSSLGSTIGQFFNLSTSRLKTLVGCGAAAGIAAAFNAPIAGALFAVEIILLDFTAKQLSPIVIASVMATVVSHTFEGDFAAFAVPHYQLVSSYEISFYFLLGGLSGLISWIFIKVLYFFEDLWDEKIKMPPYFKAAIGGLLVGSIALIYPQIMGVGYDSITNALTSNAVWHTALVLIFVKILAASLTLGSGGSGGIFAPSLFMGAMLGAFFGSILNYLFPGYAAAPGAYALVAMGGLVAGTTRAPITAIIIVFELTKETSIILPLMIVVTISMILSSKLSRESIYTLRLLQRGIKVKDTADFSILSSILVRDLFDKSFVHIDEQANFREVVYQIISKKQPSLAVHTKAGDFLGIISIDNIKEFLLDSDELKNVLIAGDMADKNVPKVTTSDSLKVVIEKMSKCDYDGLPVVNQDDDKTIIGMIWRKDVDDAYHREISRHQLTSDLATKLTLDNANEDIHFLEGYIITEIDVPKEFIGKTIKELDIRFKYGVDIISIKSSQENSNDIKAIPSADHEFTDKEKIIVAGEAKKIHLLKSI